VQRQPFPALATRESQGRDGTVGAKGKRTVLEYRMDKEKHHLGKVRHLFRKQYTPGGERRSLQHRRKKEELGVLPEGQTKGTFLEAADTRRTMNQRS
jgi:hypothetical protein